MIHLCTIKTMSTVYTCTSFHMPQPETHADKNKYTTFPHNAIGTHIIIPPLVGL